MSQRGANGGSDGESTASGLLRDIQTSQQERDFDVDSDSGESMDEKTGESMDDGESPQRAADLEQGKPGQRTSTTSEDERRQSSSTLDAEDMLRSHSQYKAFMEGNGNTENDVGDDEFLRDSRDSFSEDARALELELRLERARIEGFQPNRHVHTPSMSPDIHDVQALADAEMYQQQQTEMERQEYLGSLDPSDSLSLEMSNLTSSTLTSEGQTGEVNRRLFPSFMYVDSCFIGICHLSCFELPILPYKGIHVLISYIICPIYNMHILHINIHPILHYIYIYMCVCTHIYVHGMV
jgi:hypothetical protein